MKPVGVLGGMGPAATILFMERVLGAVDAQDDADHIPLLVDQNTQVPSRIEAILGSGVGDPGRALAEMGQRLERAGAAALVMPCNTAHHYAAQVREAVSIPFLSMVDLALDHAARLAPGGALGLLGSPALARAGVFNAPAAARGLALLELRDPAATLESIKTIKSRGVTPEARAQIGREAQALAQAGARSICVSCSEFSLVARDLRAPVPVFDALDLLVDATVRFARGEERLSVNAASAAPNLDREKETT
ncbi:MAG: amino acid racemase [Pseudomonadota bacterium]